MEVVAEEATEVEEDMAVEVAVVMEADLRLEDSI